jgi:translation initiation factor 2 subunit 1
MRRVAAINIIGVEELCKMGSWPLHKQHGDAHDALQRHINNDINLWEEIDFSQPGQDLTGIADKLRAEIDLHARRRLLPQIIRLRTKIEVTCFEDEGVDAVRDSLLRGLEASTTDCTLNISLVAHPLFALSCTCRDRTLGKETMERAMDLIRRAIQARGGSFDIESSPVLIGNEQGPRVDFGPSSSASVTSNASTECDQQYVNSYLIGHDRGASFQHNEFFSEQDLEEGARIQ